MDLTWIKKHNVEKLNKADEYVLCECGAYVKRYYYAYKHHRATKRHMKAVGAINVKDSLKSLPRVPHKYQV